MMPGWMAMMLPFVVTSPGGSVTHTPSEPLVHPEASTIGAAATPRESRYRGEPERSAPDRPM